MRPNDIGFLYFTEYLKWIDNWTVIVSQFYPQDLKPDHLHFIPDFQFTEIRCKNCDLVVIRYSWKNFIQEAGYAIPLRQEAVSCNKYFFHLHL